MCFSKMKVGDKVEVLDCRGTVGLTENGEIMVIAIIDNKFSIALERSEKSVSSFRTHCKLAWINPEYVKLIQEMG